MTYSDDEQLLLAMLPSEIGSAVAFSEKSGPIGTAKEMMASAKSALANAKDYPDNPLIQNLIPINEIRNGLFIEKMELNTEPGGEGQRTGGRGIVMEYRVRSDDGYLTMDYTRSKFPAWDAEGGNDGSPNYCEFIKAEDGSVERYSSVSGLTTKEGDLIRIVTGNGGGHGDPQQRDPELVKADIRDGLISAERAKEVYGV